MFKSTPEHCQDKAKGIPIGLSLQIHLKRHKNEFMICIRQSQIGALWQVSLLTAELVGGTVYHGRTEVEKSGIGLGSQQFWQSADRSHAVPLLQCSEPCQQAGQIVARLHQPHHIERTLVICHLITPAVCCASARILRPVKIGQPGQISRFINFYH